MRGRSLMNGMGSCGVEMRRVAILVAAAAFLAIGCGTRELDRETALRLLQDRELGTVQGQFPGTPSFLRFRGDSEGFESLRQLSDARVIVCPFSDECNPGPEGQELSGGGTRGLRYIAGTFSLGEIVGISHDAPSTAIVQARLTFNPSALYARHKVLLDRLQTGKDAVGNQLSAPLAQQTSSRIETFRFRLFDDGWRLDQPLPQSTPPVITRQSTPPATTKAFNAQATAELEGAVAEDRADEVAQLIARGADPNGTMSFRPDLNGTPFIVGAAGYCGVDMVRALMSGGADPSKTDSAGQTALQRANSRIQEGRDQCAEVAKILSGQRR